MSERKKLTEQHDAFFIADFKFFLQIIEERVYPFLKSEPCGSVVLNFGKNTYNLEFKTVYRKESDFLI